MCKDARSEVANLHLLAVQQRSDVVQEALHHELPVQLPNLRYVVLHGGRQQGNNVVLVLQIYSSWCFSDG